MLCNLHCQILKNYYKNLCMKDCIPFSVKIILSTTYSLDSDNNNLYMSLLMPHALISIIKNVRKALNDGNIGHRFFADLQKTFDIVDH